MNFLSYIRNILKGNEQYYWYDTKENHVFIPNDDFVLKITVEDINNICFHRNFNCYDTNLIFKHVKLSKDVTYWTLCFWIREYEKGLMNPMILWLANNDLGLNKKYLNDYLLFKV